ncbi:SGNH/GDSL hydrolase family protein [Peterkaempfera griseoplana]|uniref:SGNH/GDSL hydrolase family protein n=1 Tax=Peterkaempfera griseoplana TaxID=66896 RepID=UPI0006E44ACC|nr:SGNH/GDSL hydrolase family protein [Peterkaempfera griseoplana]BCN13455.1 GDSL-like lipase/acylhydrolase [Peterkaempfera griseoplana]
MPDGELHDPHCLPPGGADALLDGLPWRRFAVLGDSLAEGTGAPSPGYRDRPWAERVRDAMRRVRPDVAYRNLGRHGLRAAQVRDQQLSEALAFGPDLACVLAGGNDLLARGFRPELTEQALEETVAPLCAAGARPLLFTLLDFTLGRSGESVLRPRVAALNERLRAVAQRHGAVLVEMAGHPAEGDRGLYGPDGIHPSMRGHAVIAAQAIRALAAAGRGDGPTAR